MFYNTGIATYIWLLSNRMADHRKGKVQLIDAAQWFKPLRKNLGKKNCELSADDIQRICDAYTALEETEQSKTFPNKAFGYWKITVERPPRLHSRITTKAIESLRFASGDEDIRAELHDRLGDQLFSDFAKVRVDLEKMLAEWGGEEGEDDEGDEAPVKKGLPEKKKRKLLDAKTWERDGRLVDAAAALRNELGGELFEDHNVFRERVEATLKKLKLKLSAAEVKLFLRSVSWRVETAPQVVAKMHKPSKATADPLRGRHETTVAGKKCVVEYEPDADLRDTEQVPLLEEGGVEAFLRREVLPYTPDAWWDESAAKIGYEISFTRHFYKPQQLRSLEESRADIRAVQKDTEGLLGEIIGAPCGEIVRVRNKMSD